MEKNDRNRRAFAEPSEIDVPRAARRSGKRETTAVKPFWPVEWGERVQSPLLPDSVRFRVIACESGIEISEETIVAGSNCTKHPETNRMPHTIGSPATETRPRSAATMRIISVTNVTTRLLKIAEYIVVCIGCSKNTNRVTSVTKAPYAPTKVPHTRRSTYDIPEVGNSIEE